MNTIITEQSLDGPGYKQLFILAVLMLVLSLLIYGQTYSFDYVYFDDDLYTILNEPVRTGLNIGNIEWAFSALYMANWHPWSWISHMIDAELFDNAPGPAHIHNVLLHWINSMLLFCLLLRFKATQSAAAFMALLFLVHPLHVESVAWIAERKDLLCAFYFIWVFILYDQYVKTGKILFYLLACVAFVFSLLSKSMAVTLPALLVVVDLFLYRHSYFTSQHSLAEKLKELFKLVIHKTPFFILALLASYTAIYSQGQGAALAGVEYASLTERISTATYGYLVYLRQWLLPINLGPMYLLKNANPLVYLLLPGILFVLWLVAAIRLFKPAPMIMAGLFWYLISLLPVIGLIKVGNQVHADRYMYLPSIGVLLSSLALFVFCWARNRQVTTLVAVIIILFFSLLSFWQTGYWKNRDVFFNKALQMNVVEWKAHQQKAGSGKAPDLGAATYRSLGDLGLGVGDVSNALMFYAHALGKRPDYPPLLNNYGTALYLAGDRKAAEKVISKAIKLAPGVKEFQANYARLFANKEKHEP